MIRMTFFYVVKFDLILKHTQCLNTSDKGGKHITFDCKGSKIKLQNFLINTWRIFAIREMGLTTRENISPDIGLILIKSVWYIIILKLKISNPHTFKLYHNIFVTTSNVRSDDFDTTLIVCLLRNMRPRETAPVTGWDNLPIPGDTSTSADLARIKWYRNKLAHTEDGKLSPSGFSQYWGDLEVVSIEIMTTKLTNYSKC